TSSEPQQAELRLIGRADHPSPNVGDAVNVTFSLTNFGSDTATGIIIDAPLPPGLTLASSSADLGTYDETTGTWTIASLAAGAPAMLTLSAVVAAPSQATSIATIRRADQFDPNLSDNRAAVSISPQQAQLALSAGVDLASPNVGDVVAFTVTVVNAGP